MRSAFRCVLSAMAIAGGRAVLGVGSSAHAQSFNCAKASTPDEVLICQNPYLADLDEQMSAMYFSVRNRLSGNARRQFERDQRAWLEGRMRCGRDGPCIADAYNRRITALQYY